jgi:hypothetical protein
MLRSRFIWFILPALVLSSCIKTYEPVIKSDDKSKYVVSGNLTDAGGQQTVNVSMTSAIDNPEFIPVVGCLVVISDDKGHDFVMTDGGDGNYSGDIDTAFLKPGNSFMVSVHTPDGMDIVSNYDLMPTCPDIDSLFYVRLDLATSDKEVFDKGIQFYVDLKGQETDSRFYRWEAIETYEYHATYPREWYYDGTVHHIWPPDYSRKVCWKTELVKNIYTLSTTQLSENKYLNYPLHFVNNLTTRLAYGYSLLLNQYAISEAAYTYWEQQRANGFENGGLYERQPMSIKGNLVNVTYPDHEVLGFFGASSVRSKRIFVNPFKDLELIYSDYCTPSALRYGLWEIDPRDYPAFLMGNAYTYYLVVFNNECVDCLLLGGINVKPDFWPN